MWDGSGIVGVRENVWKRAVFAGREADNVHSGWHDAGRRVGDAGEDGLDLKPKRSLGSVVSQERLKMFWNIFRNFA